MLDFIQLAVLMRDARMHETPALIIPSIREDSFKRFIKEWEPTGLFDRVDVILIEDNPKKTFSFHDAVDIHISWEDIDKQPWSWIIPRRSDTVRSYGYWLAWTMGYKLIMTLDDDCYPESGYEKLDELHKQTLSRTRWFNTLNNVRPRGTPYKNLGKRDIWMNHGLWTNVLDYDAPQQLVDPIPETFTHDNRIVPHGAYFSFCGMNWMCRRDAIPLMYHMLMGTRSLDGELKEKFPTDRFGDIWCGLVMKKILDHLGKAVSSGTPYIHHDRASDPFTNLRKEANGIQINEWLWEAIDEIELGDISTPAECYRHVGICFMKMWDRPNPGAQEYREYFERLGFAMMTWAKLFIV